MNREFFVLFSIFDENLSWYIDASIKEFAPHKMRIDKNDEAFKHGNLIHGKCLKCTLIKSGPRRQDFFIFQPHLFST